MDTVEEIESSPYKAFWDFFSSNLEYIETFENSPHMVTDAVSKMLGLVAPDVDFLMGRHPDGYFEFILIAGGIRKNIQTILDLYSAAPQMENWVVVPFRPRQEVSSFDMQGQEFDISDFYYQSDFSDDLTHLLILIRGYDPCQEELYGSTAFMFLDTVLGEFDVMMRIGEVQIHALPEDLQGHVVKPLSALAEEVDARYPYDS